MKPHRHVRVLRRTRIHKSRTLAVATLFAVALSMGGCESTTPTDAPDAPRINLIQVTSQAGTVSYGVIFESVKRESFSDLTIELLLGDGATGTESGAPSGSTSDGVKGSKATWHIDSFDGPAIIGPFVVRAARADSPSPRSASVTWKNGRAETKEVKSRIAGVALGVGTLRQEATTANILIGRETEVTGYAMGFSLVQPREILITKDKLPDPPQPADATGTIVVASGSAQIKPDPQAPLVLEMTAPRPLPPYAIVRVETATGDSAYAQSAVTGRVGSLGDRVFIPFAASAKYRATIDVAAYKAANSPMWADDIEMRGVITARAAEVAQVMKPALLPALAATDSDVSTALLAIERARPGTTIPTSIPDGLALNGLAVCSTIACIANNAPAGHLNFCDLASEMTGCMPINEPGAEVTVTVSGRDPVFAHCQTNVCFVPGRGIVESRPAGDAQVAPIGMMASGLELIWVANPTGG